MTDRFAGLLLLLFALSCQRAAVPSAPAAPPGPCTETVQTIGHDAPSSVTHYTWRDGRRPKRARTVYGEVQEAAYHRKGKPTFIADGSFVELTVDGEPEGHTWRLHADSAAAAMDKVEVDSHGLPSRIASHQFRFHYDDKSRPVSVSVDCGGGERRVVWHRNADGHVARTDVDMGSGLVDTTFTTQFNADGHPVETIARRRGPGPTPATVWQVYECAPWLAGARGASSEPAAPEIAQMVEVERTQRTWAQGLLRRSELKASWGGRTETHVYDAAGHRTKTTTDTDGDGRDDETKAFSWDCWTTPPRAR